MAEHSRYNVSGDEGEVLENKFGITNQKALEDAETLLLKDSYVHFFSLLQAGKLQLNTRLIYAIHRYFLSTLYGWAGKVRTVEISKGGILFCASLQIKRALHDFDQILRKNMPLPEDSRMVVSTKFAVIHCEFNAIHPFREGNGRTIRLFLDLLAVRSGYGLVDYSKTLKNSYIKACVAGMQKDYVKMRRIFLNGLSKNA